MNFEELEKLNDLEDYIIEEYRAIQKLKARAMEPSQAISINGSGSKKNYHENHQEEIIIDYTSRERALIDRIREYENKRLEAVNFIQTLNDYKQMDILYKHYIQRKKYTQIAKEMELSIVHTYRLKNSGVEELKAKK